MGYSRDNQANNGDHPDLQHCTLRIYNQIIGKQLSIKNIYTKYSNVFIAYRRYFTNFFGGAKVVHKSLELQLRNSSSLYPSLIYLIYPPLTFYISTSYILNFGCTSHPLCYPYLRQGPGALKIYLNHDYEDMKLFKHNCSSCFHLWVFFSY